MKPPRMKKAEIVTMDMLARQLAQEMSVPDGAFTIDQFHQKVGKSIGREAARVRIAKLVSDGMLKQGGPKRMWYWPA